MSHACAKQIELVLVPTERHAEIETARGMRSLTLRDLAARLAGADSPGTRPATRETTRLLTRRVLADQSPALAVAVDDALGQLRRAGVQVEDLRVVSGPRAALLGHALSRADTQLAEYGLRDERGEAWAAAHAVSRCSIPELDGVGRIRVRGLSGWENSELLLLEALHQRLREEGGAGVVIEFPADNPEVIGPLLSQAVFSAAGRLEQRWATAADAPELEHVEPEANSELPRVIRAGNEASEARAAARTVQEALEAGAALDRIAIVPLETHEAFLDSLRAELSLAGVPFSEPWGCRLDSAPEAHAALELMRLARGPLRRDALVDVLRVPDLRLESLLDGEVGSGHFVEEIARLPVSVDRTGKELLAAVTMRLAQTGQDDERTREALLVAERVLRAWITRFSKLAEPHTRRGFRDVWRQFFAELGLLSASPKALRLAIQAGAERDYAPLVALGHDASAGRAIEQALERTAEAGAVLGLAGEQLTLQDFSEEFASALGSTGLALGAQRAGAVRIARAADVAGLSLDVIVVCRAASASLDWQGSHANGVLDADLLQQLPRQIRPPDSHERALFTRLALANALSHSKKAIFTWAQRDAGGNSGASRLLLSLTFDKARSRVEPTSSLDINARRVCALALPSLALRERAARETARQDFYSDPEHALSFQNGLAGPLSSLVGGEAERPIALTQLERYARCAFLGFSGSVLRATREESVGDGLNVRERGTLIHEALAVALEGSRARFGSADLVDLEQEALERAREFLEARTTSNLRAAALAAALDDVAALLHWSFANADGTWFAEAERGFGSGAEWSALPVGEYFVSGRIDRIDTNSDGSVVRIIDYKTGKVHLKGSQGAQLFQPWLYAKKVAEHYGASRVSSGYLTLQRRKPAWAPALPEGEADTEPVREKLARAEELIHALRAGYVPARPASSNACTYCDARDICRRPLSAPHQGDE